MKNKKIIFSFILLFSIIFILTGGSKQNKTIKNIKYNGNNLQVSIDGNSSSILPTTGNYYLTKYKCNNSKTELSWDRPNHKLNITNKNKKSGVSCNLTFKSNPPLSEMPIGSYVKYKGTGGDVGNYSIHCQNEGPLSNSQMTSETESSNSCLGQNAREDIDSQESAGFCYNDNYKYYTTGWRIAYIDKSNSQNSKAIIVSAASPECTSNNGNSANTKALKYCNSSYVDGNCTCQDNNNDNLCDEPSTDAWSMTDNDFYNITLAISGTGRKLTTNSSDEPINYCLQTSSEKECGYNNDLIDNGGYYWFTTNQNPTSNNSIYWNPETREISTDESNNYGLRPMISLSSSIIVISGDGTKENPYEISNNDFTINNGKNYTNNSTVTLNLIGHDVSKMCISNTKECTDYIDFTNTITWKLPNQAGEKTIYVYYKNKEGKLITSMTKKIIVDTIAPSNNNIKISQKENNKITLKVSSSGAHYMCFTETNDSNNCNWKNYQNTYEYKLNKENGKKIIYGFFKDEAGNISSKSITYNCTTCENTFIANYQFNNAKTTTDINNEKLIKIDGDWIIDSTNKYLRSNNQNQQNSESTTTITFKPTSNATLSFDYGVSSEKNYDKLTITLQNKNTKTILVNAESGLKEAQIIKQPLEKNMEYTLTLNYKKDDLNDKNSDIGYLKNLIIE